MGLNSVCHYLERFLHMCGVRRSKYIIKIMLENHLNIFIVGMLVAQTICDEINLIPSVSLTGLKMEKLGILVSML
jgi:hypothetical protein